MCKKTMKLDGKHGNQLDENDDSIETDRWHLIYWTVFVLGLTGHLPWNAVLAAQPYFSWRFSAEMSQESSISTDFIAHFAFTFKAIKFAVLGLVAFAPSQWFFNDKLWIAGSAAGNAVIFSLLATLVAYGQNWTVTGFYGMIMLLVMAAALFLATFECGMLSLLGPFPAHLSQGFLAGNSLGGILSSLNIIASFYFGKANLQASTVFYFCVTVAVFLFALLALFFLLSTNYFKHHQKKLALYTLLHSSSAHRSKEQQSTEPTTSIPDQSALPNTLLTRLRGPCAILFTTGFINIIIHPTLIGLTRSTSALDPDASVFKKGLFVPLAYAVVSAADFLGRALVTRAVDSDLKMPVKLLFKYSLWRLAFIPAFLLGNLKINGHSLTIPSLLASDPFFFFVTAIANATGAFIITYSLTTAPKRVDFTDQSRAMVILCSLLQLGVFVGSIAAWTGTVALRKFFIV